jgi:hypothetical protein
MNFLAVLLVLAICALALYVSMRLLGVLPWFTGG